MSSHRRPRRPAVAATVDVRIQHHPSRAARAAALIQAIGAGTLIPDPDPAGQRNTWRVYRECLVHPTTATHIAVIQDDAIPLTPRLADLLPRLASPTRVSSLICLGVPVRAMRAVHQASDRGEHWAIFPRGDWVCAIALIWPVALAERFVAWVDSRPKAPMRSDDGLIGAWLKSNRDVPEVRCAVPNVIEHPDDIASIASQRPRHRMGENLRRVSTCLPESDCDLHVIEWEGG